MNNQRHIKDIEQQQIEKHIENLKNADRKAIKVNTQIPKVPEIKFSIPEIEEPPEIPEIQDLEYAIFTASEIKAKTDKELAQILTGELYPGKHITLATQTLIQSELLDRSIKRNQQNRKETIKFWMAVISSICAVVGVLILL